MSRGQVTFKKIVIRQLESLNPDAKFELDAQGFIRMHRKDTSAFRLARGWICQEGQEVQQNSITLRHIYSEDEKFIVSLILYQNA